MNNYMGDNKKVLEDLSIEPGNKHCCECGILIGYIGTPSSKWASVNNGVFICFNCAGIHHGLGVDISFVRSVNLDSWNEKQISSMSNGGNEKFKAFIKKYNLETDEAPIKYKTRAADYYRKRVIFAILLAKSTS